MRRLLPLALLLAACAKPTEAPAPPAVASAKATENEVTPEGLAKAMDVPLYPGADTPDGMSSMPKPLPDGSTHYSLVLATADSPAKVSAWYASKLKLAAMGGMIAGKTPKGNDVIVTAAPEAGRTLIRIKSIAYGK